MIRNPWVIATIGVVALLVALFAWPVVSPGTTPQWLDDATTALVGDDEYVAITFTNEINWAPWTNKWWCDVSTSQARWEDTKGYDAFWFRFPWEKATPTAHLEITHGDKEYTYTETFEEVGVNSIETRTWDITTDIRQSNYDGETITYKYWVEIEGTIATGSELTNSFTMEMN